LCHQYAMIREEYPTVSSIQVCGGSLLQRTVFVSRGNKVDVRILWDAQDDDSDNMYFMLKYEVVGCPVLPSPSGGWVQQDGRLALLHCNASELSWTLTCVGTQWEGSQFNCTNKATKAGDDGDSGSSVIIWGDIALPYSVCIALILGLAVIVATIILLLGLVCLEWRKVRKRRSQEGDGDDSNIPRDSMYVYGPGQNAEYSCQTVSTLPHKAQAYGYGSNICSWPRQAKSPRKDMGGKSQDNAPDLWGPSRSEHIYESPANMHFDDNSGMDYSDNFPNTFNKTIAPYSVRDTRPTPPVFPGQPL